jgi:predicted transcriptional regulator
MVDLILSDPIAVRLPVEVREEIEKVAGALDRSRSWVIVRALRLYLAGEGRDVLARQAALAEVAASNVHDAEDIERELFAGIQAPTAAPR